MAVVMAIALAIDRGLGAVPRLGLDTRNQTAVSALLMLFVTSQTSTAYAGTRAWETAVGAAVALSADALDDRIGRDLSHRGAARRGWPPGPGPQGDPSCPWFRYHPGVRSGWASSESWR